MLNEANRPVLTGSAQTARARPTSTSRKSVKKREAIIKAATTVMNAKTYALATMTEIAAALDLRDATLYYYYPNKQALAYACHCRSIKRFETYVLAADREAELGSDKLRKFLSLLLTDSEANGPLLYFGDYFHLERKQRKAIATEAERLTRMLEDFLKTGVADGSVTPCETKLVVQLLLGMLIWLAKWVDSVEGITVDRLMAAMDDFCLRGLDTRNTLSAE